MKVLVLNGSPKGEYSITLQTSLYLEKRFPEHDFQVLHVGQLSRRTLNGLIFARFLGSHIPWAFEGKRSPSFQRAEKDEMSDDFGQCDADVLGGDKRTVFGCSRKQCSSGKGTCAPEKATGTLMDCGDRVGGKQFRFSPGNREVVGKVSGHVFPLKRFHVTAADDAACKRPRGVVEKPVDKRGLAREHDRQQCPGIKVYLSDRVQLGKNVESKEVRLVDDEYRHLVFGKDLGKERSYRCERLRYRT